MSFPAEADRPLRATGRTPRTSGNVRSVNGAPPVNGHAAPANGHAVTNGNAVPANGHEGSNGNTSVLIAIGPVPRIADALSLEADLASAVHTGGVFLKRFVDGVAEYEVAAGDSSRILSAVAGVAENVHWDGTRYSVDLVTTR